MKKLIFVVMAAVVCCVPSASANVLSPGSCAGLGTALCPGTVTDFGTDPGFFPTNVQANTGVEAFTAVGGRFSGTVDEIVALDNVTGDLDFIFQVHNDASSADALARISTGLFDGFTTDVGYSSTVFITAMGPGTRFPNDVTRSANGNTVGFDFADVLLGGLMPGETTDLLVIKTNATSFTSGTVNFINDDVGSAQVFSPSSVPEPGSLVLFGSGLLGFVGALRRKLNA